MGKPKFEKIAPYLPYGLRLNGCQSRLSPAILDKWLNDQWDIEPILQPLSDYTDVNSPAMNDLNCDLLDQIEISSYARNEIGLSGLNYNAALICFKNHIDIFRLIDEKLAIDINTLK